MSVNILNKRADSLQSIAALATNIHAAKSLFDILKSNLGPSGTCKMLVNGAGNIKITKDGSVLLSEMMIQHPTAMVLCRAAAAMDEITGDGTTSNVLFSSSLMKNSEDLILYQNVHPKFICDGFDLALKEIIDIMNKISIDINIDNLDWELLYNVCRTSTCTKLPKKLASHIANEVLDSIKLIYRPNKELDLFMIEVLHMKHRFSSETKLIRGMVLDHGSRHPDMPKRLENVYILTLNCSLEYEKSEVHAGFLYSDVDKRELLVNSERIDPPALDMLAKEGIIALRRCKRRNMERLTLCCGGNPCNSVDDLTPNDLGFAGVVYEEILGDDKFTFVEQVKNPLSCTLLIKGSSDHSINQIKDAIRDSLRAVKNTIQDKKLLPGAGATEIILYNHLQSYANTVKGKSKYGVLVFAESLLMIPRTLADNAGLDGREVILELLDLQKDTQRTLGIDLETGKHLIPEAEGIWDNFSVKLQTYTIATTVAQQMLLVDEVIKAGRSMHNK